MTQVIIPANATEAEEDAILGAVATVREGQERIRVSNADLDGNISRGNNGVTTPVDESPFVKDMPETEYLNQGSNAERLEESIAQIKAGETQEHALDETFALPGDNPIQVEIPGAEEAALAGGVDDEETPQYILDQIDQSRTEMQDPNAEVVRTNVVVLGAGGGQSAAAALLNSGLAARKEEPVVEQPKPGNLPNRKTMSNSEKKRRAAQEHNSRIRPNTFVIVKFRPKGLKMRLELLEMTQRAVDISKETGMFAIYSKNLAVSMPRIKFLAAAQQMKRSNVNQETLDWLLDQIGETAAYEVRTNRLSDHTPRSFEIEKTAGEWTAKGFFVVHDQIHFGQ